MPNSPHMLIVDDEVNVAFTLQMVFESEGYKVTVAHSCAQALKKLADAHNFDVVMTDLNMEKEDIGLDVARAAQRLKPKPVIVICTGYASVSNLGSALDLRVDYVATKPADLPELLGALRRLMALRTNARSTGSS